MNHALVVFNFICCAGIMWSCLCRMRLTTAETPVFARMGLVVLSVLSMASGFQGPLFGTHVQMWEAIVAALVWLGLFIVTPIGWLFFCNEEP